MAIEEKKNGKPNASLSVSATIITRFSSSLSIPFLQTPAWLLLLLPSFSTPTNSTTRFRVRGSGIGVWAPATSSIADLRGEPGEEGRPGGGGGHRGGEAGDDGAAGRPGGGGRRLG